MQLESASPSPTLPILVECVAGVFSEWQDNLVGHFIDCQVGTGIIEIEIQNYGTLRLLSGMTQDISRGIKRLRVKSSVTETVQLAIGDDRTRDNRVGVGGVVTTQPLGERLYNSPAGAVYGAGLTMLVAGVAGYKIRVFGYSLSMPVADDVQFYEEDGGGNAPVSSRGYAVLAGSEVDEPVFECGDGKQLDIFLLAGGILSVQVRYELVPV